MRKTGTKVELFNVPTYQCSLLFHKMGSFNRKSEFREPENLNKLVTCRRFVTSRRILGNNYAHVILTAEADSLPSDEKKLLEACGLMGCHSSRSDGLSVHARIDSTGYVRLLWESSEEDDKNSHAGICEVKFGKKQKE